MSTDSETDPPTGTTITLTRGENHWIAKDEATGVVSQGESRRDALANLDEALAGYHGEGEPPSEEQLQELGIDPERNTSDPVEDSEIFE